ncbi:FAD-dependent oxidoreductase, partial [Pseudomonas sp. NPDC087697]|uniref:FAD-dependent oxidoreductase n=1 Tax=Pseudomonas sp. NPDC087697 TaxID=3364447 RepID=UPI00382DDDFD
MQRYSGFGLFKHSLSHHENWQKMWRTPTPKKVYDVVIVGGGVARHDAVAWGFARAADALGVDLIQQTEVIGFRKENGVCIGVETNKGFIGAKRVGVVTAGNSGHMAKLAGFRLPIESHPLQALVSEPIKPISDSVIRSTAGHGYLCQSDQGDLVSGAG